METITVMGRAGLRIDIVLCPRLLRLRDEQTRLQKVIDGYQTPMNNLGRAAQLLDAKIAQLSDVEELAAASQSRARLKEEYDASVVALKAAEAQLHRVTEEFESWSRNFASWNFKRQKLIKDLGSAPSGPIQHYDFVFERNETRSREEIELEIKTLDAQITSFSQ